MFKRVMTILISALAVVFVVLLLERLPYGRPIEWPIIFIPPDETKPDPDRILDAGKVGGISTGRINIRSYEPAPSERLKYIVESEIHPEANTGKARLVGPRISFFSKKGSEVRITAPRGWIDSGGAVVADTDSIRQGALEGGVIIRDDRGTPGFEADDMVVLMDHCLYDQTTYEDQPVHKFHTDDPVKVRSPEAEIDAVGLELYLYKTEDKNNNRIKEVRLLEKVHVTMYEGGDKLKLDLTPTSPPAPASPTPSTGPASPGTAGTPGASTTAAAQGKTPYKFTLVGDVRVVRGDQSLDADQKVELVAWMRDTLGEKMVGGSRGGAQGSPSAGSGNGSAQSAAASARTGQTPRRVEKPATAVVPVVVDCNGPLIYAPVPLKDAPADFHVDAVGREVVLRDRGARAEGDHLKFDAASGQGFLTDDDGEVAADLQDGDVKIVSRRMDFAATDARRSVGFSGPGNLVAKVAGQGLGLGREPADSKEPFTATWQKGMTVAFGKYPLADAAGKPVLDEAGKQREKDYARHAEFDGQALLRQGAPSLSGEHIEIDLFPPRPKSSQEVAVAADEAADKKVSLNQSLQKLFARGNVAIHQPTEGENMTVGDMTCGNLTLTFREEPGGKSRPEYLVARQQVVAPAGRGKGYVRAEELQAWLTPDPAKPTRDRIVQMIADREVYMQQVDEKRDTVLYAEGTHLEFKEHPSQAALGPDGKPAKPKSEMLLLGTVTKPAMALRGPHRITGPWIYMNEVTGKAEVRGPGTLRLLSDVGMDGQPLKEPMPLNIAWTDGMTVVPSKDSTEELKKFDAHFQGQVRTRTPDSAIDSDDLWAFFDETPKGDKKSDAKAEAARKPGDTSLFGSGSATATRVVAAGNVVARATDTPKEANKSLIVTTIWGPTLEYQFGKKAATADGAGGSPRDNKRARGAAAVDGAGRMHILEVDRTPANVLPKDRTPKSSTTITWKKKMVFDQEQELAWFGDQVVVEMTGKPSVGVGAGGFATSGKSTLWCQVLRVYLKQGAQPADPMGRGSMALKELVASSGPEMPWVTTTSPVFFRDGEYVGRADRMSYDKATDWLTLSGQPARIERRSEKSPQKFEGAILKYRPGTGEIEIIQPWTIEDRSGRGLNLK